MIGKSKILDYEYKWYDEIDGSTFYEKDLEQTILSKLPIVYPDYIGVPFSLTIQAGLESSRPDLAMVKKDYSEWYIIEVEMARHGWEGHVEKQVRVFSKGTYKKLHVAKYIAKKEKEYYSPTPTYFELDKLIKMIELHQPKVMVIANEPVKEWVPHIRKYKALLSVFQIYKGTNHFELYRIEGDTPFVFRDKSHCELLKGSSNILIVYTPTFVTEKHNEELEIIFNGKKTKWIKMDDGSKVNLILNGSTHYLQTEKKYILYLSEEGKYYLENA
ncbi:hypothetical protein [Aquimarina sp. 2201CG14-23]|uniref:hypothetical protein n=1 Tax=Aquimarina mycalae TaxID=3040073 RepID=UPI002477D4BA|nr:hypothetical protein [Aquimarina sp. 2201CG14-23]MDH7448429.1 hypothetical protein [Aquimarina sp. 2201CG14-23]